MGLVRPEHAVIDRLLATPAVTAIASTRIYAVVLPQDPVTPAVVVQLIDEPSDYHLRGEDALTRARVQTDCYVKKASGVNPDLRAAELAEAVHAALSGQTFRNAGSPLEIEVSSSFRVARVVQFVAQPEFQGVRVMQDYFVWSRPLN